MLSILIPTFNYDVHELVIELQKQAEKLNIEYEIIICDDASTKNYTIDFTKHQSIHYLKNETNLGRTQTRRKLALKAVFKNLLFLDADVLPANSNFVKTYHSLLKDSFSVICGGCSYEERNKCATNYLRWKYGKEREEKDATIRNKKPYSSIFSGNLLIKKDVFLNYNFNESDNLYGMDIFFAYQLFTNSISVKHIDNNVIHFGLEDNEVFFKKSLESVISRHTYLSNQPNIEKINSLLKHYKTLKKWGLVSFFVKFFILFKTLLEKNILGDNPNLFLFDIYRLGYLCSLPDLQAGK